MDLEQHKPTPTDDSRALAGPLPQPDAAAAGAADAADAADAAGAFPTPGSASAAPSRKEGPLRQLLRNLRCGVRLALLLRVSPDRLAAAPGALALLAASDLLLNLAVSFALLGRDGSFAYSALPGFIFHLPLLLWCGFLAGRILFRPSLTTVIPVALVALSIPVELCYAALEWSAQFGPLGWLEGYLDAPHYYRFFWWWAAAATLFVLRLTPALASRLALLLLLAALLVPLWFFPRGDLWAAAPVGGESGELHLTEKVLSAQDRLLDAELAGLLPGEKGESHLYLVGFAGDASQDVFLKELLAAERLFTGRFGTAGRTVILANNPKSAETLPFASAANLERTLARVGRVMNRENDVLVLYLTSHGSREHELVVSNRPLELDPITPETVRRMLKKSGIDWKVLIVSACYAGGFIEPLRDHRTAVITAADASHESFGCGYGDEFTWFGEAFLDGALRSTFSFTEAFEMARATIRQWEQERGETPSNPQLWSGKEMGEKLRALEKELAERELSEQ